MPDKPEGQCVCGSVRYRLESAPMFVHCCHCRDCQKQTGGAFVINALIESDRVTKLSGELADSPQPTQSGRPHTIVRCAQCGGAMWSHYGGLRQMSFVRVATLDDPTAIVPDVHIYTRSKLPWVNVSGGAPMFEAYYKSSELWPAESLARRAAILPK